MLTCRFACVRSAAAYAAELRTAQIDAAVAVSQVHVAQEAVDLARELTAAVQLQTDNGAASQLDLQLVRLAEVQAAAQLMQATEAFNLTSSEIERIILHGFKRSFFHGTYREKRAYVRQVIDYYDKIATEHGVPKVARGRE